MSTKTFTLLGTAAAVVSGKTLDIPTLRGCDEEWTTHLAQFPRKEELALRQDIFCRRLEDIKLHNQNAHTHGYSRNVNEFTSWTKEEFSMRNLGNAGWQYNYNSSTLPAYQPPANTLARASSVDWRSKMPPIKQQGHCGSCWAFSAIDVVDFFGGSHSEQEALDCTGPSSSCKGGNPIAALQMLSQRGAETEDQYGPYQPQQGQCRTNGSGEGVSNVQTVQGEQALESAASQQVVSVCIQGGDGLMDYHDGVYKGDCGNPKEGHCIAIVGYGNDGQDDYWILRNSWGTNWGMQGYFNFYKGSDQCKISSRGASIAQAGGRGPPGPPGPPGPSGMPSCAMFQQEGMEICRCTTGCQGSCAVQRGTNCNMPFSGAYCCSFQAPMTKPEEVTSPLTIGGFYPGNHYNKNGTLERE